MNYGSTDGPAGRSQTPPMEMRGERPHSQDSQPLFSRPWFRAAFAACVLLLIVVFTTKSPITKDDGTKLKDDVSSTDAIEEDQNQPLFFHEQLVNHFPQDAKVVTDPTATWSHRYYQRIADFRGPGHPIFLVVGGEGALDTGMLYPFITEHLTPKFGAAVIEIEHRFYGPYQPIMRVDVNDAGEGGGGATEDELLELLTPQQAMADMIHLTKHFKKQLGCGQYDRSSKKYCPVITVGGSYPGFLSAMFRLVYPDFVDISYASSAPLKLYAQSMDQNVYYDIVTKAAERASPGCSSAVKKALEKASNRIMEMNSVEEAVEAMKMCVDTIPEYIDNLKVLKDDVMMAVGFTFADYDMDAYPPGEELGLYKACQVFQKEEGTSLDKVADFFQLMLDDEEEFGDSFDFNDDDPSGCFDLSVFLPDGENARIATSDWSGSGGGNDGKMWDFQLCTTLIDPIGFSPESMFPTREWTYEALTEYCQSRYGEKVTPRPYALVEDMGFDDLVGAGASRILFTNGLQDMWSGGSYLEDVSDSILALNFENGAHHSDLSHVGPSDKDTEDIKLGFVQITNILEKWLDEIKAEAKKGKH